MMNDDEDDVLGIDLDAWQPPPPPAHIADGVIARMRAENTSVTAQALPVETSAPMSKRWWLVGGATVAIAATSVITFALTRGPETARGITAGDRAAHISIGSSSADVDAYTVVSWRREGDRITAKQAGGGATWHVDDDDTLTIETGLASIQATSASLRVEVKMLDQKKLIALSAVTAAAVAVVTVVVYEGVVKAGDTTIAPGTSYQITNKDQNVIEEEQLTVGAAPDLVTRVTELEAQLAAKQAELEQIKITVSPDAPPDNFDRDRIQNKMSSLVGRLKKCGNGHDGTLELVVRVKPDGSVMDVEVTPDAPPRECVAKIVRTTKFGASNYGGNFRYPIVFKSPVVKSPVVKSPVASGDFSPNPFAAPKKKCEPYELLQKGQEYYSSGLPAEALKLFEASYACKPDTQTLKYVVAAACKSRNVQKARMYWNKMSETTRNAILSLCVGNGVAQADLDGKSPELGTLRIANVRPARVLLDGVAIGTTPLEVQVGPGKHKVTLVVGADKHTFTVNVKPGETTIIHKQLDQLE